MTIRIYPSRLEGEPIESHETVGDTTIAAWLEANVRGFSMDREHPITVTLNGARMHPRTWPKATICHDDDVRIYVEPKGAALVVAAVVLAAISVFMLSRIKTPGMQQQGSRMESPRDFANAVRWGDPIPEIAGSPLSFPDYILPPVRRYVSRTQQWVSALVCVGRGEYALTESDVFIGETPAPTLQDDAEVTIYAPGDTLDAEHAEWWHTPPEVGFTQMGGAGINIDKAGQRAASLGAWTPRGGFVFASKRITAVQAGISDTSHLRPSGWTTGLVVRIQADHRMIFHTDAVESEFLDTLSLSVNDEIELTGDRAGTYTITDIIAGAGSSGGSAATVTGDGAPSRLDFGTTPATITATLNGAPYTIALVEDAANLSALVVMVNAQLNGAQIRAREASGALELYQLAPYVGGTITLAGDSVDVFGTETTVAGVAGTLATGTRYVVEGASFGEGVEFASAGLPGLLYEITGTPGGNQIDIEVESGTWSGFPSGWFNVMTGPSNDVSGTTSSITVSSAMLDMGNDGWAGPFVTVPEGEITDAIEVDIFFPGGLVHHRSKGGLRPAYAGYFVQWRPVGSPTWNQERYEHNLTTQNQIGFTHRIDIDPPARVEVRISAINAYDRENNSDERQWTGLRARLGGAPQSYAGLTLMHVKLRSGDRVSGQAENKLSVRATRILPTVANPAVTAPTRDIAPFLIHMMDTVGYDRSMLDMAHIAALHAIWSGRGDTFDLAVNSTSTLKTVANYCLGAGFAEVVVQRGKISASRDAERAGSPLRIYGPQESTAPLVEASQSVMPDDIDGVDAEYVDYQTGRTMTVPFRLAGDSGLRTEVIKVPGVTSRTRAWRLAARRRRIAAFRRTEYQGETAMAAMTSYYMDHVGLQDGIPEWGQSAFLLDFDGLDLTLSEEVRPVTGQMVAMIRRPDGTATDPIDVTAYSGQVITLDSVPVDAGLTAELGRATVVYLGEAGKVIHEALMTEVTPSSDGRVRFRAVAYDDRIYADDDGAP